MIFCIFSFNRGEFLDNCVRSVEQCVTSAEILIFDDCSDDARTLKILSKIGEDHTLIPVQKNSGSKHGGLYNNMQMALRICSNERIVCFLQDDMQIVRSIGPSEIDGYKEYFQKHPRAGFLQPCFLKGAARQSNEQSLYYDEAAGVYQHDATEQSAGIYYSDIFVAVPQRLQDSNWVFKNSEPRNERQAKQYFDRLGHMFAPFAMWLPGAPAYRGKRKTLALKIAEKRGRCGFNPYNIMTDDEVNRLKNRSPKILPFAEDFLTCSEANLPTPWSFYPLQGYRWLKKLNSYELFLRRIKERF